MYLGRLKRYDPVLKAVITLTEERALRRPQAADAEIARGKYRGPLHGIPWGAKDLLAVKGYKTTWGAGPVQDQVIDADATVVQRLDAAGAVLVAKLTLGELAQGDIWFGGTTKNPWNAGPGIERLVGRPGVGDRGGARRLRDRERDARLDLVAVDALRRDRPASDLRPRAAHRRDGAVVDDGQARADLPQRRRLRAGARRDPWTGRTWTAP